MPMNVGGIPFSGSSNGLYKRGIDPFKADFCCLVSDLREHIQIYQFVRVAGDPVN